MVYLLTKIPNSGMFCGPSNGKCLPILVPFGIFYGRWSQFVSLWYRLWSSLYFGIGFDMLYREKSCTHMVWNADCIFVHPIVHNFEVSKIRMGSLSRLASSCFRVNWNQGAQKLFTSLRAGAGWPDWANFRPLGDCFLFGQFFENYTSGPNI
jgi:hypothetical protein